MKRFISGKVVGKPRAPTRIQTEKPLNTGQAVTLANNTTEEPHHQGVVYLL